MHTTATAGTMVGKWVVCVFLFCVLHFRRGDTVLWCSIFKWLKKGEGSTRPSTWSPCISNPSGMLDVTWNLGNRKEERKENVAI